ncbi:MAG: serine/threonine protein phosphatase [Proteobacteria bacterium]|nr:serine/threonine protein phosphatase [Pseudomonadota bacterium]
MTKTCHENYAKISTKLAEMSTGEVAELLEKSEQVHQGIGGTAVKLEIEGVPIFAKRISLTDLELDNPHSTKNLFNLPTFYQYGVGSAGFGAWRELAAHQMTTDWFLNDECPNFPLLYGHCVVPKEKSRELNFEDHEFLDADQKYWGGSPEVRARLEAIENATHSVVVFLESIPQNLGKYLFSEEVVGRRNVEMIECEIRSTTAFLESKGMIHFDGHNGNILTDGEQIYFSDFGLATSLEFELSEEERAFFEKNRGYDLALGLTTISRESKAKTPEVAELAQRYKTVRESMRQFEKELRGDPNKLTEFPAEEMRKLCRKSGLETLSEKQPSGSFTPLSRSKSCDSFFEKLETKNSSQNQRKC